MIRGRGLLRLVLIAGVPIAAALCPVDPAIAGPPYFTDDPEPADLRHWEIYGYVAGSNWPGEADGEGGFDINYGAARDLQLTMVVPVAWEADHGLHVARGDMEIGAKYRFIHQSRRGLRPDISFFPSVGLPTGSARRGCARTSILLPLWAQKDWGEWSMFGGGGYSINRGRDRKNSWQAGAALTRALSERLEVGAELYRETSDERDETATLGAGFGATFQLGRHAALLGSVGPRWRDGHRGGSFFLALEFHR